MQRQFKLKPSPDLALLLIAAHGITLAALLPLALPLWAKTALAFLVLLSLGYQLWRKAWLHAPSSCIALALEEKGGVVLTTRNGNRLDGKIMRDSLVTPYLAVLNILPQDARLTHSVVILADSLDEESFRQLRVWLKWGVEH